MASKAPRVTRNPELIRGIRKVGRSQTYHKRGLWAIKAKNGGKFPHHEKAAEAAQVTEKPPKFYPADDVKKPLSNKPSPRRPSLGYNCLFIPNATLFFWLIFTFVCRASIIPGTVLIILAGRFKGKRVIFLMQLASGLLLVTAFGKILVFIGDHKSFRRCPLLNNVVEAAILTPWGAGPFKINGVPLRRVDQAYVIASSTKVDISAVSVDKYDDKYFAKKVEKKKTKGENESFEAEKQDKVTLSAEKKDNQKAVDVSLLKAIESVPDLEAYLGARFLLKAGMKPHEMVF